MLPGLRSMWAISLLCRNSNPVTTSLAQTSNTKANHEKSNLASTKWTNSSRVDTFFIHAKRTEIEAWGSWQSLKKQEIFLWLLTLLRIAASNPCLTNPVHVLQIQVFQIPSSPRFTNPFHVLQYAPMRNCQTATQTLITRIAKAWEFYTMALLQARILVFDINRLSRIILYMYSSS